MTTYRIEERPAGMIAAGWVVISTDARMVERVMITHLTETVAQSIADAMNKPKVATGWDSRRLIVPWGEIAVAQHSV